MMLLGACSFRRRAYWTGVGRQTVWGKGVIRIMEMSLENRADLKGRKESGVISSESPRSLRFCAFGGGWPRIARLLAHSEA